MYKGPLGFFNIHSVAIYETIKAGPFGTIRKFSKKFHSAETTK